MSSLRLDGVRFAVYSNDHATPHVHGKHGTGVIVVELFDDGSVALSARKRAIVPANMKKSDIKRILRVAKKNTGELRNLWKGIHGKPD